MEKVIVALRTATADDAFTARLCGPVAAALLDLNLPGLTINVRDAPVRDSLMTLTTLDPPMQALVSVWTEQHYGRQLESALMPPPASPPGERAPGLANIALLRRPATLDEPTWLHRWQRDHTPVAIRGRGHRRSGTHPSPPGRCQPQHLRAARCWPKSRRCRR